MGIYIGEFADWRDHPITKMLMASIDDAFSELASDLVNRATVDTNHDQYVKGVLRGLGMAKSWTPDLVDKEGKVIQEGVEDAN